MYRPVGLSDAAWRAIVRARAIAEANFAASTRAVGNEMLIATIVKPVFFVFAEELRRAAAAGTVSPDTVDAHLGEFRRVLCVGLFFAKSVGGPHEMFEREAVTAIEKCAEWRTHLAEFAAALSDPPQSTPGVGESASNPVRATSGASAESRRREVDDYITHAIAATKLTIIRADIWRAAGYTSPREFQKWQAGFTGHAPHKAFRRVLNDHQYRAVRDEANKRLSKKRAT
jgi:hypothetical protein